MEQNLLVHLVTQYPFNRATYFTKQILVASANHVKQLPFAPFVMSFLLKYTQINYTCETKHDPYVPEDEEPAQKPQGKGKAVVSDIVAPYATTIPSLLAKASAPASIIAQLVEDNRLMKQ